MNKLPSIAKLIRVSAVLMKSAACFCLGTTAMSAQGEEDIPRRYSFSQPHLGTVVRIVIYSDDRERSQKLAGKCFERIEELNQVFSDYLPGSEVSRLCARPVGEAQQVSDDLFRVLVQAREISTASGGAFDVTVGKATERWRENKEQEKVTPTDTGTDHATYRDVILDPSEKTVLVRKPLKIDFGGIAKGYIADQLMVILRKAGMKRAAVIIGGEMVFGDAPPGKEGWTVGIERPSHQLLGTMVLSNTALSTSGDSYQFIEQDGVHHSHLIDPSSRRSKTNRLNVTTLAPTAMLADAWATALRVSDQKTALKLANEIKEIEAAFIPFEEAATLTPGFPKLKKP